MEHLIESVRLAPNMYVIATASGFRLYRPPIFEGGIFRFAEALLETGTPSITRQLLAGAFYAGLPQDLPEAEGGPESGPMSLLGYIHLLAAAYQTTHATPPTMRRVAERFAAQGRHDVAARCQRVAKEESGHDRLALRDLDALGLPAVELVARIRPQTSLDLVERFIGYAESDQPIACFGYAYALERRALFITAEHIAAIERVVPPGIKATRCLRVHSAVGSDARHVQESIDFIATLPGGERAAIVRAVYETVCVMYAKRSDYPGDAGMRALLDELGSTRPLALEAG